MNMATKILIVLLFIATNSLADTTIEEFRSGSQDMRLYQAESSSGGDTGSDEGEQESTGTPTELILDAEPEC